MAEADDIGRWSERVAGRRDALDPQPTDADLLRDAIRAEDALAAADRAADRVGLERLTRRLESEGLLEPIGPADPGRDAGRGAGRPATVRAPRWLALAASLAVVAIGIGLLWPVAPPVPSRTAPGAPPASVPGTPTERPRGFAGVVKQSVADPDAQAASAVEELTALGFVPRRIDADARVVLAIDVGSGQLDAYRRFVEPRGGRVAGPGEYRVIFEQPP